jgi:Apea-like HEPN
MTDSDLSAFLIPKVVWKEGMATVFLTTVNDFECAIDRIALSDGTALRTRTADDDPPFASFVNDFLFGRKKPTHVVESTLATDKFQDAASIAIQAADRVLLALRLLKETPIFLGSRRAYQPGVIGSARTLPTRDAYYLLTGISIYREAYALNSAEIPVFREIYGGLARHFSRAADVAFRRFDLAQTRSLKEDKLLDYWVGLESLFAKQGETQELSYKFALRIAHYIGDSPTDRLSAFNDMREAYVVRSKVVHGEATSQGVDNATVLTERALRDSLRRAALEGQLPDIQSLDNKAASGR